MANTDLPYPSATNIPPLDSEHEKAMVLGENARRFYGITVA